MRCAVTRDKYSQLLCFDLYVTPQHFNCIMGYEVARDKLELQNGDAAAAYEYIVAEAATELASQIFKRNRSCQSVRSMVEVAVEDAVRDGAMASGLIDFLRSQEVWKN
jgi:hypothetical protein